VQGFFSLFGCVPHVRQRPEVALFGFVSTRSIAFEVLIKASFIKKKEAEAKEKQLSLENLLLKLLWLARDGVLPNDPLVT